MPSLGTARLAHGTGRKSQMSSLRQATPSKTLAPSAADAPSSRPRPISLTEGAATFLTYLCQDSRL